MRRRICVCCSTVASWCALPRRSPRSRTEGARYRESLGQVASQTLENIQPSTRWQRCPSCARSSAPTSSRSSTKAREIGTYELSTQDHEDCCTLFMPRNPETHARVDEVWAETELEIDRMVADALADRYRDFACPAYRAATDAGEIGP